MFRFPVLSWFFFDGRRPSFRFIPPSFPCCGFSTPVRRPSGFHSVYLTPQSHTSTSVSATSPNQPSKPSRQTIPIATSPDPRLRSTRFIHHAPPRHTPSLALNNTDLTITFGVASCTLDKTLFVFLDLFFLQFPTHYHKYY